MFLIKKYFYLFLLLHLALVESALALTLDDVMGAESARSSERQATSGSLLDGVESGRTNAALVELKLIGDQIKKSCACFQEASCKSSWSLENSDKSSGFVDKERQLLEKKRQLCFGTNTAPDRSSTSEEIRSLIAAAQRSQASLQGINKDMGALVGGERLDASFRQELAEEQLKKSRRAEENRQIRAQDVRDREELDRDWAVNNGSNSDQDFWNGIQGTVDDTMVNIERQKRTYERTKHRNETKTVKQSQGYSSPANIHRSNISGNKKVLSYEAEKQNCINAGKKWQSGGGCDYSSSVTIQGWTQGDRTATQPADSTTKSFGDGSPSPDGSGSERSSHAGSNQKTRNGGLGSPPGGGSKTGSNTDYGPRLMPVFVQKEGDSSWSKQETACDYAKAAAIRMAKAECKQEFNGRTATKDEIEIPVDANCHSYRQLKKSTIMGGIKGEWKATSGVTLQCLLPEKPFANPVAPPSS